MPTHCHYYIGDMQQVCDCEPRCVPACCDDAEERLEATIASQSARIVELEAELADERHCLKHALLREETLKAERDAVRKALEWMYRRREVAFAGDTLEAAIACCDAWEPEARLIGNVRAVTLGNLLRELSTLRTALESAQADRQRAVDDLFAQLRVNESLRAESMRGAVCWHCKVCLVVERPVCERCPAECDDEDCQAEGCEEQQAASQGQPERGK